MLTSRMCIEPDCPKKIPEERQLGTAYCSDACKAKLYRKRKKLDHDKMYMKIDKTNALVAVHENRLRTGPCTFCPSVSLLKCQSTPARDVLLCLECFTVMNKRKRS